VIEILLTNNAKTPRVLVLLASWRSYILSAVFAPAFSVSSLASVSAAIARVSDSASAASLSQIGLLVQPPSMTMPAIRTTTKVFRVSDRFP